MQIPKKTNFEGGERAPKKHDFLIFWSKFFQKVPENAFFGLFLAAQKFWSNYGLNSVLRELRISIWST